MEIVVDPQDIPNNGFDPSPVPPSPSTPAPVTSEPCSFCEGYGINSDFVITGSDVTCGQVLEYAPTVLTGSDECANVQLAEAVCCTLDFDDDDDGWMSIGMSYTFLPSSTAAPPVTRYHFPSFLS
jgi:hypothetical protein